jgi:parvulin-like peptidyl-prolyl isomerase
LSKGKKKRRPIEAAAAEEIPAAAVAPSPASSPRQKKLTLLIFGAALLVLLAVLLLLRGNGDASVPAGDVVLVEDVPDEIAHVSESEFDLAVFRQAVKRGLKKHPEEDSKQYKELKDSALDEVLEGIWIQGEAEELGIQITPTQIAQRKARTFKSDAQYRQFLKSLHLTAAEARQKVKIELLNLRLKDRLSKQGSPSRSDIHNYYNLNSAEFKTPETRDVRVIINADKSKVEAALKELKKGHSAADWKKVAAEYSSNPSNKAIGGLEEGVTEKSLHEPLKADVFEAGSGELLGPIHYSGNYLLIEVEKANAGGRESLKDAASSIRRKLSSQAMKKAVADYESKWISRSLCAPSFATEKCANYKG